MQSCHLNSFESWHFKNIFLIHRYDYGSLRSSLWTMSRTLLSMPRLCTAFWAPPLEFVSQLYTDSLLSESKEENTSVCLALETGNKLSAITLLVTVLPSFKYILQVWYLWIIQWCWDSRGTQTSAHSFAHSFLTAPSRFPSTFLTFTCHLIFPFKWINCLCRSNICLCIHTVCSLTVPWPLGLQYK